MSDLQAMRISQLGNCADFWRCLDRNPDPRYTFGGFRLNTQDLKRQIGDNAVLSADARSLLDQFCVLANPSQNPLHQTIAELFASDENVELIFDPISSEHLRWIHDGNRGDNTGSDIASDRALFRLEIQYMLQADMELQQRLIRRLNEKQWGYATGWTHFRTRVDDFWTAAVQECLDTGVRIYDPSQSDLLDCLFFANPDNLQAYLSHLYASFEDKNTVKRTLSSKITALRKDLNSLAKHILTQEMSKDPGQWKAAYMNIVRRLITVWSDLWPAGNVRKVFDCCAARDFQTAMNKVEGMNNHSLRNRILGKTEDIPVQEQADAVLAARKLLADAQTAWRAMMSQRTAAADETPINEADADPEILEGNMFIHKLMSELAADNAIRQRLKSDGKDSASAAEPTRGRAVFIQESIDEETIRKLEEIFRKTTSSRNSPTQADITLSSDPRETVPARSRKKK